MVDSKTAKKLAIGPICEACMIQANEGKAVFTLANKVFPILVGDNLGVKYGQCLHCKTMEVSKKYDAFILVEFRFEVVKAELASRGIAIKRLPDTDEYRVNFKANNREAYAYYTDNLMDAYQTGLLMSREV